MIKDERQRYDVVTELSSLQQNLSAVFEGRTQCMTVQCISIIQIELGVLFNLHIKHVTFHP